MTSTRRRPTVRGIGGACLLTLALSLAACGGSPDPAPAAPSVPPAQYQVPVDQLPDGWRTSNTSGDGYRTTICGVDLEPAAPVDFVHYRFAKGPVGPFLEQHVRSYTGDTAAAVIGAIQTALPGCREFEAAGDEDSPAVRFSVEPLTLSAAGPDTVAWRQEPADGSGVVSDIVLTRRGNTAVLLMAYGLRDEPDRAALTAALAAVRP
jgi:hypothetical protein